MTKVMPTAITPKRAVSRSSAWKRVGDAEEGRIEDGAREIEQRHQDAAGRLPSRRPAASGRRPRRRIAAVVIAPGIARLERLHNDELRESIALPRPVCQKQAVAI